MNSQFESRPSAESPAPRFTIDASAPAVARHETIIHAPLPVVWSLIANAPGWPSWNSTVISAKISGTLAPGAIIDWKSGGVRILSIVREVQPMQRLAWTGRTFGTRAKHLWTLDKQAAGVRVATEESFDGWLPRLLPGMMRKSLDRALETWLRLLKTTAEAKA